MVVVFVVVLCWWCDGGNLPDVVVTIILYDVLVVLSILSWLVVWWLSMGFSFGFIVVVLWRCGCISWYGRYRTAKCTWR